MHHIILKQMINDLDVFHLMLKRNKAYLRNDLFLFLYI